MPQYRQPDARLASQLNDQADVRYDEGAAAGDTSDKYVLITVYFSTVLILIAISGHFRIRSIRTGLIVVGALVLVFAVGQLTMLPAPPA